MLSTRPSPAYECACILGIAWEVLKISICIKMSLKNKLIKLLPNFPVANELVCSFDYNEGIFMFKYVHNGLPKTCKIENGTTLDLPLVMNNHIFLQARTWLLPWIKSISNELDIIFHMPLSQLSGQSGYIIVTSSAIDCDVISKRVRHGDDRPFYHLLWIHYIRQEIKWCIYFHDNLFMLTEGLFWCLFPSLLCNSGNKEQNNPLVSAKIVCHSST